MRILQVHNKYRLTGGEDTVLQSEFELLSSKHHIEQFLVGNDSINSAIDKIRLLFSTHYSASSYKKFKELLRQRKPDVVHVHNFFPLLTPSIFDACKELNVPSVMTLHNYRLIDPSAILAHKGKIYEKSIKGSAYNTILDKVYRNSMLQTAIVAHMIEYHRKRKTWQSQPNKLIALTSFAKEKFVQGGIPERRIVVKPNFAFDSSKKSKRGNNFLFVGRLSEEKGVPFLLKAWSNMTNSVLDVVGNGPLERMVSSYAKQDSNINWRGPLPRDQVLELMSKSKALIFPSLWYEGFPMVIVEALSLGTPVITSNIGSQKEIIHHEHTGLHFESGNVEQLIQAVQRLLNESVLANYLSKNSRKEYLEKYTPEKNLDLLTSIYRSVINEK